MGKEICLAKLIETDDGFSIEVTGKSIKDMFCCLPMFQNCGRGKTECCPTETEGK